MTFLIATSLSHSIQCHQGGGPKKFNAFEKTALAIDALAIGALATLAILVLLQVNAVSLGPLSFLGTIGSIGGYAFIGGSASIGFTNFIIFLVRMCLHQKYSGLSFPPQRPPPVNSSSSESEGNKVSEPDKTNEHDNEDMIVIDIDERDSKKSSQKDEPKSHPALQLPNQQPNPQDLHLIPKDNPSSHSSSSQSTSGEDDDVSSSCSSSQSTSNTIQDTLNNTTANNAMIELDKFYSERIPKLELENQNLKSRIQNLCINQSSINNSSQNLDNNMEKDTNSESNKNVLPEKLSEALIAQGKDDKARFEFYLKRAQILNSENTKLRKELSELENKQQETRLTMALPDIPPNCLLLNNNSNVTATTTSSSSSSKEEEKPYVLSLPPFLNSVNSGKKRLNSNDALPIISEQDLEQIKTQYDRGGIATSKIKAAIEGMYTHLENCKQKSNNDSPNLTNSLEESWYQEDSLFLSIELDDSLATAFVQNGQYELSAIPRELSKFARYNQNYIKNATTDEERAARILAVQQSIDENLLKIINAKTQKKTESKQKTRLQNCAHQKLIREKDLEAHKTANAANLANAIQYPNLDNSDITTIDVEAALYKKPSLRFALQTDLKKLQQNIELAKQLKEKIIGMDPSLEQELIEANLKELRQKCNLIKTILLDAVDNSKMVTESDFFPNQLISDEEFVML